MTYRIGDSILGFEGDNLTPEQREQDRWLTMANCSIMMAAAGSAEERMACLRTIFEKFSDVPNGQPDPEDTAAYARFAVKTLLGTLIKPANVQERVSVTTENVFNEWIDAWLVQSSHAPPHA
jgi:hypothetical protein